jgi:thymidylate synthase
MKFTNKDLHPDGRPYTKEEFINEIKTDDDFAKKWGELGPIYGKQWRSWGEEKQMDLDTSTVLRVENGIEKHPYKEFISKQGIDQIANLINDLKTNPDSRRLMVNAWNVGELDQMVLPPCHYGFQVYTRELDLEERRDEHFERLDKPQALPRSMDSHEYFDSFNIPTRAISLMWSQRSCDVPLGIPFNIASYALLLELLAKMTNMVPDELIGNLGDTHIYHNQVDGIKEQLTREPYQLPKLNINTEWWPTESGECGEGPIDAQAVLEGFSNDNFCKCLIEEDIQLGNYKYHPTIKMPLSN